MLLLGCPLKDAYGGPPKTKAQLRKEDTTVPRDKDANDLNQTKPCDDLGQIKNEHSRIVAELRNEIAKIKTDNLPREKIEDVASYIQPSKQSSKSPLIEAFATGNDQFNELLLYIFTGIFFIIMFDYMYKFGKKSF